jgi:hypothetical protein
MLNPSHREAHIMPLTGRPSDLDIPARAKPVDVQRATALLDAIGNTRGIELTSLELYKHPSTVAAAFCRSRWIEFGNGRHRWGAW